MSNLVSIPKLVRLKVDFAHGVPAGPRRLTGFDSKLVRLKVYAQQDDTTEAVRDSVSIPNWFD